jgi:CHAD domain-containing protein
VTTHFWVLVSRPAAPSTLWIGWPGGVQIVPPEDASTQRVGRSSKAHQVIQAAITSSIDRVLQQLPLLHLPDDPAASEAIHRTRVGLRRLRCDLRTFGTLVDDASSADLLTAAKRLSVPLGELRDNEVVQMTLAAALDQLPGLAATEARPLFDLFDEEQKHNRERLLKLLDGPGYDTMVSFLSEARESMPMTAAASRAARKVMPGLMADPWKNLDKAVAAYLNAPADNQLHMVRINAKRCRYGAEVLRPVVGKSVNGFVKAMTAIQETLGIVNDAAVIGARLREAARYADVRPQLLTTLLGWLETRAAVAREQWLYEWNQGRRRSLRFWE